MSGHVFTGYAQVRRSEVAAGHTRHPAQRIDAAAIASSRLTDEPVPDRLSFRGVLPDPHRLRQYLKILGRHGDSRFAAFPNQLGHACHVYGAVVALEYAAVLHGHAHSGDEVVLDAEHLELVLLY